MFAKQPVSLSLPTRTAHPQQCAESKVLVRKFIWRVRRRRKAFSISEGPAAGRSIPGPDGAMPSGQWRYLLVGGKS